ncbi:Tissue inhibitor of metalloproteinase [Anthophora quadrimaculata]
MWQLRFWTYFLLLALSLAPVQRVVACSCMRSHPQKVFCQSDFVVLVKVKKMNIINEHEASYNVKINKFFKVNNGKTYAALKKNLLFTPSMDSMCSAGLTAGKTYVVSGNTANYKAHISLCGLSMQWRTVNRSQRKAFRQLYKHGCSCQIHYTHWWTKGAALENTGGKECLWESQPGPEHCQTNFGICMPISGGCSWFHTIAYKNCIKEYQQQQLNQQKQEKFRLIY